MSTLVFYLNCRFAYSILYDTSYAEGNTSSRSEIQFLSLKSFPNDLPTTKSTIQEWERQAENPMIGLYRYSSISTIQLPTADLEDSEQTQTEEKGSYPHGSLPYLNDIVVLTRKGHKYNPEDRKRTPNQDRVLVLSRQEDNIPEEKSDWWMGLFDGHGYHGHLVSQYVSLEFARRMNKLWRVENTSSSLKGSSSNEMSISTVKEMLKATFLDINHSIPSFMTQSGSTGISVLKRGKSLYVSNLGDSVAFVASYNKADDYRSKPKIIYSTKPHKPDTPTERERIEESGGRVQDPPFEGLSARLIIPVNVGFETIEVGLAMSRSLGDHDGLKVGLIAEPDTDVLDLSELDKDEEYIVVAVTDGLVDFDKLSEEEVAVAMAEALSTKEGQSNAVVSSKGTEAARKLILKSSEMWDSAPGGIYRDDISLVAHKLRL
jgi:serine/threonine protein phosphatase PrpC